LNADKPFCSERSNYLGNEIEHDLASKVDGPSVGREELLTCMERERWIWPMFVSIWEVTL